MLLAEHAKGTQSALAESMRASLGQMDAAYQARFNHTDARVDDLAKRLAAGAARQAPLSFRGPA